MNALTLLVTAADENHDTQAALALIVLSLIGVALWAASEFQLRRPASQERIEQDRDAIAETIGLIDQRRSAVYAGEFADQVEQRLTVIDGGAQ